MNTHTHLFIAFLFFSIMGFSQQQVEIDLSHQYQTIQGFGASDAWNTESVGKYWEEDVKNDIAEKLFSQDVDQAGTPLGIGLSRWRFNIGAGSAEQGANSNIEKEERRSECFITSVEQINGEEVVTYDWNKQQGQQWFLNAANNYGVEQLVAFVNSPPTFYTKNGRANSDNTDRYGSTNLGNSNYNRFSAFMVNVLKHFSDQGVEFSQISPINEPQYPWNSAQEGCPWKHDEVYKLIEKLDRDILAEGLGTKILLSEAADYRYLTGVKDDSDKSDIVDNYFNPTSDYYMGNFSQLLPGIGAHSYWINTTDANLSTYRANAKSKVEEYDNLELYQTEYNLLSQHYDDKLLNSIFLAKIIYSDLEIAGVSIWDYWTAMERERWSQKNRFFLLKLTPSGGSYASLENSGTATADKNLWALGNFSRFIRPGYKRIKTTGADDLGGLMGVSFLAPDSSDIVTVYVNWSDADVAVNQVFKSLPDGIIAQNSEVYITDQSNDLTRGADHDFTQSYSVPSYSIITFRTPLVEEEVCDLSDLELIQAECLSESFGINIEAVDANGIVDIGSIKTGYWAKYSSIDLSTQNSVSITASSNGSGGYVELRLGGVDGELISTVIIPNTGGWDNWQSFEANIERVSGEQELYLLFKGGGGWLYNIDYFGFSQEVVCNNMAMHIEAECYTQMNNVQTENCSEGTENVGWINNGDWVMYSGLDLTGMKSIKARTSGNTTGSTIEVRLGSELGTLIGTLDVSNSGGSQNWLTDSVNIIETLGSQDVYLVFKGGSGYLFNVNYFQFSEESTVVTSLDKELVSSISIFPNPTSGVVHLSGNSSYMVFNSLGQEILSGEGTLIDLSNKTKGVYSVKVGERFFKIIKK